MEETAATTVSLGESANELTRAVEDFTEKKWKQEQLHLMI